MKVEKFGWKESGIDEFIPLDSYPNLPVSSNTSLFINIIALQFEKEIIKYFLLYCLVNRLFFRLEEL
jgi:hypothetical protein